MQQRVADGFQEVNMDKKLNVDRTTNFIHHRDGWGSATAVLKGLHCQYGVRLLDWADRFFKDKTPIRKPWCGFLHNALTYPEEYPRKYTGRIYPLSELVNLDFFRDSLPHCHGLFTLSKHTANFLRRTADAPVENFVHPARAAVKFNWQDFVGGEKRLVSIGQWLRRYHTLFQIKTTTFDKCMLKIDHFTSDYHEMLKYVESPSSVKMLPYMNNQEYDDMLSRAVVFLDLYDVAACNVVLECIMRNTPILVRALPGTVEYLGSEYPLFFDSVEEAESKLHDMAAIEAAHLYLDNMNKSKFSPEYFLNSIVASSSYKKMPKMKL